MGVRSAILKLAAAIILSCVISIFVPVWGRAQSDLEKVPTVGAENETSERGGLDEITPEPTALLTPEEIPPSIPIVITPAPPIENPPSNPVVISPEPPAAVPTQLPTVVVPEPTPESVLPQNGSSLRMNGNFVVSGSTILGPDGRPFVARGVNVNGYNWVWQRRTVDDVNLIVDCWKFNLIRVNSFLFSGEQPWPQYGDNNDLDAIIETYTRRGVVVVLEAHDRIGRYYEGSDLTALVNWFTDLARRYANNPYVWFDVMNEPGGRNGIDANNWINMHSQVIHAIRNVAGAHNIIIVEGASGGQDAGYSGSGFVEHDDSAILQYYNEIIAAAAPTFPANIVFSIHPYDLWNYGDAKMAHFFDRILENKLAMIVGEYGVLTDQETTAAASSVINTAPPRGIGRIVWHWDGHDYNDLTAHTTWGGGWEINDCNAPTNLSWLGLSVWIDNHTPGR